MQEEDNQRELKRQQGIQPPCPAGNPLPVDISLQYKNLANELSPETADQVNKLYDTWAVGPCPGASPWSPLPGEWYRATQTFGNFYGGLLGEGMPDPCRTAPEPAPPAAWTAAAAPRRRFAPPGTAGSTAPTRRSSRARTATRCSRRTCASARRHPARSSWRSVTLPTSPSSPRARALLTARGRRPSPAGARRAGGAE